MAERLYPNTEEAAAFDSCSAYQIPSGRAAPISAARTRDNEILFLSHCVPHPPDKGERIRASHELRRLARSYRVHLACFARSRHELDAAMELRQTCASVYAEPLDSRYTLLRAGARYVAGESISAALYSSVRMRRHVERLRRRLCGSVAFSAVMAAAAPDGIPLLLDMVDVDSEKWFEYARLRFPSLPYRLEGRRLRRLEAEAARRAAATFVTTDRERALLQAAVPSADVATVPNGVDGGYFDPSAVRPAAAGRMVVFVGAMGYYPNADAARWYAAEVHRAARERDPQLEFFVVGRDPGFRVRRLSAIPGVKVTGAVPDVRPYLAAARAVVAPLRIARGIQNKVLEALAMGKRVLASPAVCDTFGGDLPAGVIRCQSTQDYLAGLESCAESEPDARIRAEAQKRFSWDYAMSRLNEELDRIVSNRVEGRQ